MKDMLILNTKIKSQRIIGIRYKGKGNNIELKNKKRNNRAIDNLYVSENAFTKNIKFVNDLCSLNVSMLSMSPFLFFPESK